VGTRRETGHASGRGRDSIRQAEATTTPPLPEYMQAAAYFSSPEALLATTDGGKTWHVVLRVPSVITNP
jgi:hypothetical protein